VKQTDLYCEKSETDRSTVRRVKQTDLLWEEWSRHLLWE